MKMLLTYSQEDIQKLLISIWSYLRFLCIIIHNIYSIPIYLLINWVLLSPLYYTNAPLYMRCENTLYNWLLYIVSSWSYGAGIYIHEFGDDMYRLKDDPNTRLLIIANHQSTADVPLMMQSLQSRSLWRLLWIMDVSFKWTNFGVVSVTHGDYFLNTKRYVTGDILAHITTRANRFKNTVILFPEGGFRYKRIQSSNKFAAKHNYPVLLNVTYPRFGAYSEIIEPSAGITHVVDLTIGYEDLQNPLSIVDIGKGDTKSKVIFNYRIYDVNNTSTIRTEQWLNERWHDKERLLHQYYTDRAGVLASLEPAFNVVTLNWLKVIAIHCFYLSFWFAFYVLYKHKSYLIS